MKHLSEALKIDMAIEPQERTGAGQQAISEEFSMAHYEKALFVITLSSADFQRDDVLDVGIVDDIVTAPAASGDLALLDVADDTLIFENIEAAVRSTQLQIDVAAAADGIITINGTAFPFDGAPTVGTLEWDDRDALVLAINAADIGLTAEDGTAATQVLITSTVAGAETITLVSTVAAVGDGDILMEEAVAYLEVDASRLGDATAVRVCVDNVVANTGDVDVSVVCIRQPKYKPAAQAVAVGAAI